MPAVKVRAGASGYSYKPWKGPFYPEKIADSEMLAFYAERLPAVEINNTFYRMPKKSVLENWAAQTPESFRFSIKASRRITHMKRLKEPEEPLGYLYENLMALGDKVGVVLYQLPPNMKKDLPRLEAFLAQLPDAQRTTFEFRHTSWFEDDVFDALRAKNAALCLAESDDEEKSPPLVATADWGYLRLRRAGYTKKQLRTWAERVQDQGWTDAYVFFKHEDKGAAPKLAAQFMTLLED